MSEPSTSTAGPSLLLGPQARDAASLIDHLTDALGEKGDVVMPLGSTPFGRRGFVVRDPEGILWSVGTHPGELLPAVAP